jgi:hypothetical protein
MALFLMLLIDILGIFLLILTGYVGNGADPFMGSEKGG